LPANATEQAVPVELSGDIIGGKLNIELSQLNNTTANKTYLIKFTTAGNADVTNKYILPSDYYVRDEQSNGSGYAILYPQTTFDLEYNFTERKLYKIEGGQRTEAWWYTTPQDTVTLSNDNLYKYKGYDLFKDPQNNVDRNITLTGSNSNQTFIIESRTNNITNNINVTLDTIDLTNSRVAINDIKSLKLKGVNTINSINQTQNIFSYTFNNAGGNEKVLTENDQSYLKIFTKKGTNPFNGSSATGIDFKFFKEFTSNDEVRLVENSSGKSELKFTIPKDTGRLGVLFGSSNKNKTYNLYHGESGTTGNSVYVSGNTQASFKESFETASNNTITSYDYVRRANPVNRVSVNVPNPMSFSVSAQPSELDGIKPDNWEQYFNATDMTIENNSRIVKDQFTDEHGVTHYFGETNTDLELGYMGVSPSGNSNNGIKLVSKDELDSNITNSSDGVKLALKFLDESCKVNLDGSSCKVHSNGSCQVPIDETKSITAPLKEWTIPSNSSKTLKIIPDFNTNNRFFNVNMNSPDVLYSSHKFTFRFGFQKP